MSTKSEGIPLLVSPFRIPGSLQNSYEGDYHHHPGGTARVPCVPEGYGQELKEVRSRGVGTELCALDPLQVSGSFLVGTLDSLTHGKLQKDGSRWTSFAQATAEKSCYTLFSQSG